MSLHCLSQKKLLLQILPDFLPQQNFPQFVPLAALLLPALLLAPHPLLFTLAPAPTSAAAAPPALC